MRDVLAERLLGQVMNWTPADVARERPILQALATLKYDEYQQFSPGMRFVESLALWLNQFAAEEQAVIFRFIKERIIFFSDAEMNHLVSIAFQDFIRPVLISLAALEMDLPEVHIQKIVKSDEYKLLVKKSLFLGLSDGAHIDVFRRSNPGLSHEQILQVYDISDSKADELKKELKKRLETFGHQKPPAEEVRFRTIFLLDDFSASGISYIRKEQSQWKGKISKVLARIISLSMKADKLFDLQEITVCVVLYIATQKALNYLEDTFKSWLKEHGSTINLHVIAIQSIGPEISINTEAEKDVVEITKRYYNADMLTSSYEKGNTAEPYLGFDGCGLPVVLSHNTPNNSLPLLWFSDERSIGLFPRVSRHKEEK